MSVTDEPPLQPVQADHEAEFARLQPRMAYDGGDFAQWKARARPALAALMGVPPMPDAAIEVEPHWQRANRWGTVHKLTLRAESVGKVLAYWCVPAEPRREPMPAMICLQGHSPGMHVSVGLAADERTEQPAAGDRDMALQCMQRGIAALCIEQRGFGQRRDQGGPRSDCHFMSVRAMMLGRSLVAERVMDVQVGLRWLRRQAQVDAERIGVMGQSAGGTATTYAAGLTEGLRLAVPSCSFGPLREVWFRMQRCMCGCVPGILQLMDVTDVLALHAPQPVVIVTGEHDEQLPGSVARAGFEALKLRYAAAGAGDACQLVVGPEGHRFYADLAWPAMLEALG
ncbi:MAG: alpha/beta hydrolase family protein [Hyphomicrobiales bacterium]